MASNRAGTNQGCVESIRHSKVKLHDPGTGKSVILLNPGKIHVRRIRMDRCFMPTGSRAADYLVSIPTKVDVIVELKGKNVDHAITQIEATRLFWRKHEDHQSGQFIGALIVCTEYPRADLKIKRYMENFRASGGLLKVSRNGEERAFEEFIPKHP